MATTGPQPADRALEPGAHQVIRARRTAVEALPCPDEEWCRREVPDIVDRNLEVFRHKGIVAVVGHETGEGSEYAQIYRTSAAARAYLDSLPEPGTPCGHTGVRNVRGEDSYTCCYDACDTRFDRETAKEVFR